MGSSYHGDQERELLESGWDGLKGFSRLDGSVLLPSRQWAWKEGSFFWKENCLSLLATAQPHSVEQVSFTSNWLLAWAEKTPHGECPVGESLALSMSFGDCKPCCGLTEW